MLGLTGANSTEFDPNAAQAVISELPEQKEIEQLGGTMRLGGQDVLVSPGSLADYLYRTSIGAFAGSVGAPTDPAMSPMMVRQRFRHRYEVEPKYIEQLESAGLVFSGRHPDHPIMQILELPQSSENSDRPSHPYFIAAQFHPELTGRPLRPQPLFMGLVAAAIQRIDPGADVGVWGARPAGAGVAVKHSGDPP